MNCDHAAMYFKTRNEAGLIDVKSHSVYPGLTGKDHESSSTSKTSNSYLEFDNYDYAKRFAKAFIHAVELCGGKPSKF
jgi:hypothetical protein